MKPIIHVFVFFAAAFCMVMLVSEVEGSTCQCTCSGTGGSGGGGRSGGYWGAAESMNKPDGVDNQKYTFGEGEEIPEGFNSGNGNGARGGFDISQTCKSKGGQCVPLSTCGNGPKVSASDCLDRTKICCVFVYRKRNADA